MYKSLRCSFLLLSIYISQVSCQHDGDKNNDRIGNLRSGLHALQSSPRELQKKEYSVGLDFFVMGYPKTGTSAMMLYLDSSDELKIVTPDTDRAFDSLGEFHMRDEKDVQHLFDEIEIASLQSKKYVERYGIKWPGAISGKGLGGKSLEFIEKYNPKGTETKILIGIRHPVRWFESFYKYRHGGGPGSPPTTSLIGNNRWNGVSTDRARFEEGIMQLGKLPLRPEDKQYEATHEHFDVITGGTPYKVFLYLEEQLDDNNKERHGVFLNELSSFLELEEPFTVDNDVPHKNVGNKNHFSICGLENRPTREELVKNGKKTAEWIRSNLPEAEGFVLANKDHFLSIVDTFGTDPCDDEDLIS